jgi:RNA polymerase primary sigma factor
MYPLLTKEQEVHLAKRVMKGDRESLNELIESNLSFVVKVSTEYRSSRTPFRGSSQRGNLGLIEAAHRFDHRKGTKIITYAIWWIRKSILKALSEHVNLVRVPTYQMKKVKELRDAEKSLRRELGRKPKREEISEHMDASIHKIDEILQVGLKSISLDDKIGREKESTISDYLIDDHSINPELELIKSESNSFVQTAMSVLSDQEKIVITHRFGLRNRLGHDFEFKLGLRLRLRLRLGFGLRLRHCLQRRRRRLLAAPRIGRTPGACTVEIAANRGPHRVDLALFPHRPDNSSRTADLLRGSDLV